MISILRVTLKSYGTKFYFSYYTKKERKKLLSATHILNNVETKDIPLYLQKKNLAKFFEPKGFVRAISNQRPATLARPDTN